MGVTWPHGISELGQFTTWFGLGVYLKDINSELLTLAVNSGDNQTPLTMTLQFETGGPTEVQGSISIDVIKFEIIVRLTLRFHQPTAAVDLFGWVDDINGVTYTPQSSGPTTIYTVAGTFLGQPVSGQTTDPAQFKTELIGNVVHVTFTTSSVFDPGGADPEADSRRDLQPPQRRGRHHQGHASRFDQRDGELLADGRGDRHRQRRASSPTRIPCTLQAVSVNNDVLTLNYICSGKDLRLSGPARLAGPARARRALAEHRPYRGPDAGEPLLRSHARLFEPAH